MLCNFIENNSKSCKTFFKLLAVLKIFRTLRKVHKLCNFIQNNLEAGRIFKSCWQSEKVSRTLRKFNLICNFNKNNSVACETVFKLWAVWKVLGLSGRSIGFVTVFQDFLKLFEFFTNGLES